jgi:ribosomal subunit interface protein
MTLSWNVITKNMHPHEQLQEKLREKISKLERHLEHFPPDAVHLQVALDRHKKKQLFTAALTLRVPSNVLRSSKGAADPIPALDQAVKALLREISSFKSALRREAARKRAFHREQEVKKVPARFAAQPLGPGQGPQTLGDVVRQLLEAEYNQLLLYVRHQIEQAELELAVPKGAIDAEAVADEVARQAITRPESKPDDRTYRVWIYSLARRELDHRCRDLRDHARTDISIETASELAELPTQDESEASGGFMPFFEGTREELDAQTANGLPDFHSLPPDLAMSDKDLIDHLQSLAKDWPPEDRAIFQLHFLEGFEADEVAMLEKKRPAETEHLIEQVQSRLRQALTEALQAKASRLTYDRKQRK